MIRSFDIGGPASARTERLNGTFSASIRRSSGAASRDHNVKINVLDQNKTAFGDEPSDQVCERDLAEAGHEEKTVRGDARVGARLRALPASMTCKHDFDWVEPWGLCGL